METSTIRKIKKQINQVDEVLKNFVPGQHKEESYGKENEYTAQSLKNGIDAILTGLRGLVKAHNKFVRLSTFKERDAILSGLVHIARSLADQDYSAAADHLDNLKPVIQGYNVMVSPETQKVLEERASQLIEQCSIIEEKVDAIREASTSAESNKGIINSFARRVEKREQQLNKQEQFTDSYQEQLASFEEERKEKLEEAKELISQARNALGYKTAEGLSAAFGERYIEEKEKGIWSKGWLVGAAIFIGGGICLFLNNQAIGLGSVISRIVIMSVAFSGAWFCAAQYVKYRNTREDYGYKAVLSKSMMAFLEQLKGEEKESYLKMVLTEIHKDPLRKRHDDSDNVGQNVMSTLSRKK